MSSVVKSPLTSEQITVWLRGLLTIAWADGQFDEEEQLLIAELTQEKLAPQIDLGSFEPISPEELAATLRTDPAIAENFLRTAVMVALADGVYSATEDNQLQQFCEALGQQVKALDALRQTLCAPASVNVHADPSRGSKVELVPAVGAGSPRPTSGKKQRDVLEPVRHWLDGLEIEEPQLARFLCKMIPPQCPFARDITLFGHKVVHIPPLCKLNPLYDQLVGLRFRSLSYLADECGEDVTPYC